MSVLAVVVLYKRSVDRSQTLTSLGNALKRHPELFRVLQVLLWDNSPMPLNPTLAFPFRYVHANKNVGTSGAFNYAMEFAEAGSIPWLLLLDQDTTLSEDFIPKMLAYSRRFTDSLDVAAVVPLLWCRGQVVSPKRFRTLVPHFAGATRLLWHVQRPPCGVRQRDADADGGVARSRRLR